MADAVFIIRDGARRKASPCAVLRYADETGFEIEIEQDVDSSKVPAFFIPFVEKREYRIPHELSLRWVRERIPPSGRQNLGEVLSAHGLSEYSELALLRSGRGESSQDSFIVEEIDAENIENGIAGRTEKRRKALGAEIKARRESLNMSQRELANQIGIDQPALSKVESGKSNITFDILFEINQVLAAAGQPFLRQAKSMLWNEQRRKTQSALEEHSPDLGQTYKRLIDELELYDEKAKSAIADSRIISHCFREIMDSFPAYVDDVSLPGMQGQEQKALNSLFDLLERQPLASGESRGVESVSLELYNALIDLQESHFAGTLTNNQKIKISVGGTTDNQIAPISAWKEAQSLASKTAHLPRKGSKLIPSFTDYLSSLSAFENYIEGRIGSIYEAKHRLLDIIGRANRMDASKRFDFPRTEEVRSFVSLLGDSNLQSLAFRELKNPCWLESLEEEGFFETYTNLDESILVPFFPAPFFSLCLASDQQRVIRLLRHLSKDGWSSARGFLVELATELADADLKDVSPDFIQWAKNGYGIGSSFWYLCNVEAVVSRMLKSTNNELRKDGRSLFQQLVLLRKRQINDYPYEKIEACIPDYRYAQFVESLMPSFSLDERMMISRNMLNMYVLPIDKGKQSLPTRAIAYSLEDKDLKEIGTHKKFLVSWVKEYKKTVLDALKNRPQLVDHKLLEQKPLVLRCIMSCLHEFVGLENDDGLDDLVRDMIKRLCFKNEILFSHDYEGELIPLLADFALIGDETDKEQFLHSFMGWLDVWENEHVDESSPDKTEYYEREKDYLKYAFLSVFPKDTLPRYLLKIREGLEEERGEFDGPRQLWKVATVWGPNSPLDIKDFREKGPERTLAWLQDWEPSGQDRASLIEHEGVSRVLARLVEESPLFFDEHASKLKSQKLIYISGIIDGWQNAVKAGKTIPMGCAIDLCAFALSNQGAESLDVTSGYDANNGMNEAKRHIAWFLVEILEHFEAVMSESLMHDILMLLLALREDGLAIIKREDMRFAEDDPVTASMNVLSSISLSGIMQWILRSESKYSDDIKTAFETLDDTLSDSDTLMSDVAAFGIKIRGLFVEYKDWLEDRYESLFGRENPNERHRLLLALQISLFDANPLVFDFLKPALKVSLQQGMKKYPAPLANVRLNSFEELLGYRIFQLFAVGKIGLDDQTAKEWRLVANPLAIGAALREICSAVRYSKNTTEEIAHRVRMLWEELACRKDVSKGILQGAFCLIGSHFYPHDWLRSALLEESRSHNVVDEINIFFDDVHVLASEDPEWGIKLLRAAIENDAEREMFNYGSMPHALFELYRNKFGKEDNADVLYCMDELGRMGILDLDLIEGSPE